MLTKKRLLVFATLILSAATLYFCGLPKLVDNEGGADHVMNMFQKAKERALKSNVPTGVRLQLDNKKMVTRLVMIEQENETAVPIVGEDIYLLPDNMAIDCNMNVKCGKPLTFADSSKTFVDILFEPSGKVIGTGDQQGTLFWVRDITLDDSWGGDPVIVTLQYDTGFLKTCSLDPTGLKPYRYAWDDTVR